MTALILWGHALAALLFGGLAFAQARRPGGHWPQAAFLVALIATSLWALAVAGIDAHDDITRIVESVRNIAWLVFMLALVRRDRAGNYALSAVYLVVMGIVGASVVLVVVGISVAAAEPDALAAIGSARLVLRMMGAVSALILTHHLYEAAPASRGGLRLVVLGLAAMWSIDLLVYTTAYFGATWPTELVVVRGLVMAGVAALLGVAVQRSGDWTLSVSRSIAVRALSAVALVLYAGITILATGLAEGYAGSYARAAQTAIVAGATAALFVLLSTPWLRAWTKVMVAKHLFRHRYDYRSEWQRFTDTLGAPIDMRDDRRDDQRDGQPAAAVPLDMRVIKAIADLTDSPGGLLLVPDGTALGIGTAWNWDCAAPDRADGALAGYLAESARIVELDRVRMGAAPDAEIASVPEWLHDCAEAWAIVPLFHGGGLIGAIVLGRPPVDRPLDWEDFDLLRIAGRQAASYLAEDRAHAALADAARFDEFNRRFAFILHDIKNLVSQLTLVARNAERHADNPDFRADMVATLKDSSDRMTALLARLSSQPNPARSEPLQPVDVAALVAGVASGRRAQHPIVAHGTSVLAMAQIGRLEQVLGHLVQNAIEASGIDAPVVLSVTPFEGCVAIDVIDEGCGMPPGFVRDQLFRPFVSSKPGGFGIGAFEARQLVQAMGGTLEVTSREAEGTRFRILLPLADQVEVAA